MFFRQNVLHLGDLLAFAGQLELRLLAFVFFAELLGHLEVSLVDDVDVLDGVTLGKDVLPPQEFNFLEVYVEAEDGGARETLESRHVLQE